MLAHTRDSATTAAFLSAFVCFGRRAEWSGPQKLGPPMQTTWPVLWTHRLATCSRSSEWWYALLNSLEKTHWPWCAIISAHTYTHCVYCLLNRRSNVAHLSVWPVLHLHILAFTFCFFFTSSFPDYLFICRSHPCSNFWTGLVITRLWLNVSCCRCNTSSLS